MIHFDKYLVIRIFPYGGVEFWSVDNFLRSRFPTGLASYPGYLVGGHKVRLDRCSDDLPGDFIRVDVMINKTKPCHSFARENSVQVMVNIRGFGMG